MGGKFVYVDHATHIIQASHAAQFFGDGQNIGFDAFVREGQDGIEDDGVRFAVEVDGTQKVFADDDGVAVLEHGAQDGLLGFDALRRHLSHGEGGRFFAFLKFFIGIFFVCHSCLREAVKD